MKGLALALLAAPAVAHADDVTASKATAGLAFEFDPDGSFVTSNGNNGTNSADLTTAVGLELRALYAVHPNIAIGIAPRFATHIKGVNDNNGDTSNFLDLRLMVEGRVDVLPKLELFGYGGVGYGIVFLPSNQTLVMASNPTGATVSFGGGVAVQVSPTTSLAASVGYELGYESATITVLGFSGSGDAKYDHVIVDLGVRVTM